MCPKATSPVEAGPVQVTFVDGQPQPSVITFRYQKPEVRAEIKVHYMANGQEFATDTVTVTESDNFIAPRGRTGARQLQGRFSGTGDDHVHQRSAQPDGSDVHL